MAHDSHDEPGSGGGASTHPDEVFNAARRLSDPAERGAYLDSACAGDAGLRQRVDALLAAYEQAASFLESPAAGMTGAGDVGLGAGATLEPATPAEQLGATIGRYKLLERIGEGGFGVVYMAEQHHPVRRRVALKVVKPGMDSRQVLARFDAERQALAIMDHPNIAKVFDGGMTDTGRPYFVMELVKGEPITEFCDRTQLPPRQRLELFAQVCHAVQHAHQKGIIHRDIKPTNVLVALHDATPVVKVIDFGIAKALGQELTEKTLFTGFAQLIGTPLYMSPEQAGHSALDVDTRSDIYSLGVLLYELLTGSTPFDKERFRRAAQDEIRRIIREEDPPCPSTRLSESKASLASISAQRDTEPGKLTKLVRGELDWIVMKELEKDRGRRYETANGFATDVQRYLAGEAVLAVPPSAAYRLRKFVRRNRPAVLTAAAVAVALLVGAAAASWQAVVAVRAKRDTLAAAAAETRAKEQALAREAETRAVLDFVDHKILRAARPAGMYGGLGHDVSLRQAIEAALPSIETSFRDQPLIEARLRVQLGWSFSFLGEVRAAADQFAAARAIYTRQLGPEHPDTLSCVAGLAVSYGDLGRDAEALKLLEETLSVQKAKLGPDHESTLWTMHFLANARHRLAQRAGAVKLNEEALALRRAKLGPDHPDTLWSMSNLGISLGALGRHDEALKLHAETLAVRKAKLGADDWATLESMSQLAHAHSALGRHDQARELHEETLARRKVKFGPDHLTTLATMCDLAICLDAVDRRADAHKLWGEALPLMRKKVGPDHPATLWCMKSVADSHEKHGRHDDALETRREMMALATNRLTADHPDAIFIKQEVACSLIALGRDREALEHLRETLARRRAVLTPEHHDTIWSLFAVADRLVALGRAAEAVPLIDEYVQRAGGEPAQAARVLGLLLMRSRHFKTAGDAAGVRATAEMWEKLNRTDADSLYNAACFRAVTSAALAADPKTPPAADATRPATEEADRAMAWLHTAAAAGFKDAWRMMTDADLVALRGRKDFKKLLAELVVKNVKKKN